MSDTDIEAYELFIAYETASAPSWLLMLTRRFVWLRCWVCKYYARRVRRKYRALLEMRAFERKYRITHPEAFQNKP